MKKDKRQLKNEYHSTNRDKRKITVLSYKIKEIIRKFSTKTVTEDRKWRQVKNY